MQVLKHPKQDDKRTRLGHTSLPRREDHARAVELIPPTKDTAQRPFSRSLWQRRCVGIRCLRSSPSHFRASNYFCANPRLFEKIFFSFLLLFRKFKKYTMRNNSRNITLNYLVTSFRVRSNGSPAPHGQIKARLRYSLRLQGGLRFTYLLALALLLSVFLLSLSVFFPLFFVEIPVSRFPSTYREKCRTTNNNTTAFHLIFLTVLKS